jgi:hypothetical protein
MGRPRPCEGWTTTSIAKSACTWGEHAGRRPRRSRRRSWRSSMHSPSHAHLSWWHSDTIQLCVLFKHHSVSRHVSNLICVRAHLLRYACAWFFPSRSLCFNNAGGWSHQTRRWRRLQHSVVLAPVSKVLLLRLVFLAATALHILHSSSHTSTALALTVIGQDVEAIYTWH